MQQRNFLSPLYTDFEMPEGPNSDCVHDMELSHLYCMFLSEKKKIAAVMCVYSQWLFWHLKKLCGGNCNINLVRIWVSQAGIRRAACPEVGSSPTGYHSPILMGTSSKWVPVTIMLGVPNLDMQQLHIEESLMFAERSNFTLHLWMCECPYKGEKPAWRYEWQLPL